MIIHFLGTRGEIEPKTKRHMKHTATLLSYRGTRVMIDCGENWLGKFNRFCPQHIVLTHAHPDHAFGLKEGAPCPVWASRETWKLIDKYPLTKRKFIPPRKPFKIGSFLFEAFPVLHSIRCPAVGYRIQAGRRTLFYVPDVAWIPNRDEAFADIDLFIGDGATLTRPMIRKDKDTEEIFGHATIRQELGWCEKEGVTRMIITHCGSDIVKNEKRALARIKKLAKAHHVEVEIAYDGLKISL